VPDPTGPKYKTHQNTALPNHSLLQSSYPKRDRHELRFRLS
jgi:hypothetical protein